MELPNKKYKIIYADPPWKFEYRSEINNTNRYRRTTSHYDVMDLEDIKKLPIKSITNNDCVLFLWTISPLLDKAFEVINSWGFKYKTIAFTWIKTNSNNSIFKGMGYWTMSNTELCLLSTRGHPKRVRCNIPEVVLSKKEKHSKKPDVIRNKIVSLIGNVPRIELFARNRYDGWDCYGNQLSDTIQKYIN